MLGGIAAFQRFRHSQFDSGTSNQKGKTISYKLKESGKMFTKIKRKTIGNLFGIQCKKKLLSKRSAWRAMMCTTKQKWTLLCSYSTKTSSL